jgi:hypothetical protein
MTLRPFGYCSEPWLSFNKTVVTRYRIDLEEKLLAPGTISNRHGFESVSIHQIMAGAGLTHAGFYSYFDSKSDPSLQLPMANSEALKGIHRGGRSARY